MHGQQNIKSFHQLRGQISLLLLLLLLLVVVVVVVVLEAVNRILQIESCRI